MERNFNPFEDISQRLDRMESAINKIAEELEIELGLGLEKGPMWDEHQTDKVILSIKISDYEGDETKTAMRKQFRKKLRIMIKEEKSISELFLNEYGI